LAKPQAACRPRLTVNLFSGGKHAGGQGVIQGALLIPLGAKTNDSAVSTVYTPYPSASRSVQEQLATRPVPPAAGGCEAPLPDADAMFQHAVVAIMLEHMNSPKDVALGVDVAASHFYRDGKYQLGKKSIDSAEMIARVKQWIEPNSIISVEDGLAEEDW